MRVNGFIYQSFSSHVDDHPVVLKVSNTAAKLQHTRGVGLDKIIVRLRSGLQLELLICSPQKDILINTSLDTTTSQDIKPLFIINYYCAIYSSVFSFV